MNLSGKTLWFYRGILLAVVLILGVVFMPSHICPGDPLAVRAETVHLLNTGEFCVPENVALTSGEYGQYYFHNPIDGRYYSKYGILNTLGYIPVLALEKSLTGELPFYSKGTTRLLLLNANNILLSLLLALVLFELGCMYSERPVLVLIWVLASLYCGFCWFYLRAQTAELGQWLLSSFFMLMLLRAFRSGNLRRYLSLAAITLVLLILNKSAFAVWGFVLVAFGLYMAYHSALSNAGEISKYRFMWKQIWPFMVVLALGAALVLAINAWKFGGAFTNGYGQWEQERGFFNVPWWEGFVGLLVHPQKSIFIYHPLLLIAVWYWKKYWSEYRGESLLVLSVCAVYYALVGLYIGWRGDCCYGPRHLLVMLVPLTFPVLLALDSWWKQRRKVVTRLLGCAMALLLLCSAWLQIQVNALEFFTYYQVEALIETCHSQRSLESLRRTHFGILHYQMIRFAESDILPECVQLVGQDTSSDVSAWLQRGMLYLTKGNYYFFTT